MCGIAGAIALTPTAIADASRVATLTDCLAHRGPDGTGVHVVPSGRAVFGHRRLSVIDLENGQQPMVSPDGRYAIVFNGEIYNYRELRESLVKAGEVFRTQSDTEVLLRLLIREGESCLDKLRGMFAFAFWDDVRGRAILARDRVGKKPLYYVRRDGVLMFASALVALREVLPGPWTVSPAAIDTYMSLGYIPAPGTVYDGVSKLVAGTFAVVDGDGQRVSRYWSFDDADRFGGSFAQAVDQLDALLTRAVEIRLRADVPLGVFLSGGIDSSLVTAIANRLNRTPIRTFSIAFDHDAFDESPFAAEVARHLGTEHRRFDVHADVLDLVPRLAHHFGEPFADSSAIPTYVLSQRTRDHVTVALGGDGGDEGFAGYLWYQTAQHLSRLARVLPAPLARALASAARGAAGRTGQRGLARAGRALDMLGLRPDASRFAALRSFMNAREADALYGPVLRAAREASHDAPMTHLMCLYERAQGSTLRRMRVVDIETYLADCLLPKVDVASMAHSLEVRAPLLDHEVLQFALSLPDEYVLSGGKGKTLLRALLGRYIPATMFDRPKQGFSLPLAPWFRRELRPRALALGDGPLVETGFFRREGIRALVEEHDEGTRDHSQRLYSLLMLETWLRRST